MSHVFVTSIVSLSVPATNVFLISVHASFPAVTTIPVHVSAIPATLAGVDVSSCSASCSRYHPYHHHVPVTSSATITAIVSSSSPPVSSSVVPASQDAINLLLLRQLQQLSQTGDRLSHRLDADSCHAVTSPSLPSSVADIVPPSFLRRSPLPSFLPLSARPPFQLLPHSFDSVLFPLI